MPTAARDARTRVGADAERWSPQYAGKRWASLEGPQWRLHVGPGLVRVSTCDYGRRERLEEATRERAWKSAALAAADASIDRQLVEAAADLEALGNLAAGDLIGWGVVEDQAGYADWLAGRQEKLSSGDEKTRRCITAWSRKSRAAMLAKIASLDFAPLFAQAGTPAMVTLTYPGDWLTVAPDAKVVRGHVEAFKKRFARDWSRPLVGVWKREFQRRGAPHYHIHMVPPVGVGRTGEAFRPWLSRTWAEVVGHPDADERERHRLAGTGVDYAAGLRATDPKRLAVYFMKHGSFAEKEYQNEAPAEWVDSGEGVGRFWGVWGLAPAVSTVEVAPEAGIAAGRVMRRWQEANGYRDQRMVWRKVYRETLDTSTGELVTAWKWRKRRSGVRVGARMRGVRGFVVVNDGPAFAGKLAGYVSGSSTSRPLRDGSGFLP